MILTIIHVFGGIIPHPPYTMRGSDMLNLEELRKRQALFEIKREESFETLKEIEKIRQEFVSKFSILKLKNMDIDEYIQGKGSRESFCYIIERKLEDFGKISGTTPADKRFGIYYDKKSKDYKYVKKFGQNPLEAFENIRHEIVEILSPEVKNNKGLILNNKLSPMFKGKILATYYPNEFLNIFSEDHIDYFLQKIERTPIQKTDLFSKKELLLNFKNNDEIMKDWTINNFSTFLYFSYGSIGDKKNLPEKLKQYITTLPPITDIEPVFIDPSYSELPEEIYTRAEKKTTKSKIDFGKKGQRDRDLGYQGELIVMKAETIKLLKAERPDLAKKVKHESIDSDSLGYDITSYNLDGSEKHIEVKSTSNPSSLVSFHISDTQYKKINEDPKHCIYLVLKADTINPQIIEIDSLSEMLLNNTAKIKPESYSVKICLS